MIIDVNDFDYNIIRSLPRISKKHPGRKGKHEKCYINSINAFDIETSRIPEIEQSVMYIWQFQIGLDITVIGRTWYQYMDFIERISRIAKNDTFVIYVHNLSYEFCFLKGVYDFETDEVFRTEPRKVLKCSMFNNIEYRCSYYLTNLSLDRFTRQMGVQNRKLSGEKFDYSKIRFPETELTQYEIDYCINDVKGLVQALTKLFELDHDDIISVPLTSTGYVRRDLRNAMKGYNHKQLQNMLPDLEVYYRLEDRFRGGDTHRNRWLSNRILHNVSSTDRVSSYPDVMLNCLFPMSKFYELPQCTMETLKQFIKSGKYALLIRIAFHNISLKSMFDGAVYLSRDKCDHIINGEFDNGRVLSRDYLETCITSVDLSIILDHYKFTGSNPYKVYYRKYGKLPKMLTNVIMKYYKVKTELKGIPESDPDYIYYCNRKARLNSVYGCLVQSSIKKSIDFKGGVFTIRDEPARDLLKRSNDKAFLNYRWGVWT